MSNQIETHIEVKLTNRNRVTAFWRWILIAPVAIFLGSFTHFGAVRWSTPILVLPVALALIFRGVYPSYALTFNHALLELGTRATAYALLLTDDYPSIERNPNIAVMFPDVDGGKKLNRWLPLVKWFLAIPLYIVGTIYFFVALALTIYAWITTSVTGNYPESVTKMVLGTVEYWNRTLGYSIVLVTDEYPSFSI